MVNVLKWIKRLLSRLVLIVIIFHFYSCGNLDVPVRDVTIEITAERVAMGKQLAEGIMACGSCHTTGSFIEDPQQDKYLAGDVMYNQNFGNIRVGNLTPDKDTGLGNWTDGEIIRALTKGIHQNGRPLLPMMPWAFFGAALTEEEVYSLVAYLRTVPDPVYNEVPKINKLKIPFSILSSSGILYKMDLKNPIIQDYNYETTNAVERGKRLAFLGFCIGCHAYAPKMVPKYSEPLAGGLHFVSYKNKMIRGANLTLDKETGIGSFKDEGLKQAIKYGARLRPLENNDMVRWPMMQRIPFHTNLSDEEINDLISFLRTQEPLKHDVLEK